MTLLEQKLQEHAYYGNGRELVHVDVNEFFDPSQLVTVGKGLNARVFKVGDSEWVVKEGRWDLDANLFKNFNVKLNANLAEKLLKNFKMQFLPNPDEIKRQYDLYMKMVEYFGYFKEDEAYYHPDIALIFHKQEVLRAKLLHFLPGICEQFALNSIESKLRDVLSSAALTANFTPKEYVIYGDSISPENKGNPTYYLFQHFVKGSLLHDVQFDDMKFDVQNQIVLLAFLVLLISITEEMVPDLRPRYLVSEGNEWFFDTDNIIVDGNKVTFIDTRWMWGLKDNLVKRGIMIPELTIESVKLFLINSLS